MNDSNLIDVSATAAEVGYGFNTLRAPVLLTQELWDTCVKWDQGDSDAQDFQEQDARLWDVLFVCGTSLEMDIQSFLITMSHKYSILVIPRDGSSTSAVKASLEASINSGQDSLVIDLIELLPEEIEEW